MQSLTKLFGVLIAGIVASAVIGCSSSPSYETSSTDATTSQAASGSLNIHGNLARSQTGQNALHLYVNGQRVIDGPLDELYTGSNSGRYGNRDIRADCATRRLNLHDFRVTCDVFVDGSLETTLGF